MCNQNNISNNVFFILLYSDFYEIPLPALRFEKTEEIDKSEKRHWREERHSPTKHRKYNDAHQFTARISE